MFPLFFPRNFTLSRKFILAATTHGGRWVRLVFSKSWPSPPRHWRISITIGLIVLVPWPIHSVLGQGVGSVAVSPKRVVLEGRQRAAEVILVNRGTSDATYRIFFTNLRMSEDGRYQEVTKPKAGEFFADKMIRYSPRQVTVPGQGSQSVRLLVRKPRDLPPGEYRSHLVFRSLPPDNVGESIEPTDLKQGEIQVKLIATYSVSIPIIVRHGKLAADVGLSGLDLKFERNTRTAATLVLRLERAGERSVYGDLSVTYEAGDGVETVIGRIGGIAVFTPNKSRTLRLPLSLPDDLELKHGVLRVVYRARAEDGGAVLAEAEMPLP